MSLVEHVCRLAPEVESLFYIAKSSCAFSNFKDQATSSAAQQAVHESQYMTMRLVSRLRQGSTDGHGSVSSARPVVVTLTDQSPGQQDSESLDNIAITTNQAPPPHNSPLTGPSGDSEQSASPALVRYFVLKSLTVEDLELSVKTGVWATQAHNEQLLNSAFEVRPFYEPSSDLFFGILLIS